MWGFSTGRRGQQGHLWANQTASGWHGYCIWSTGQRVSPGQDVSKIIDIQAAADLLAVDYKTVYRLIQSGELPAAKIGRVYRLAQDDVEHYFEQRKTATMRELRANGTKRRTSATAHDADDTARTCAWCGRSLVLNYSVGAECAEPGCGAPICRACARNGAAARCPAHVEPGDRSAQVERLRAEGALVVGAEELRVLAGAYLTDVAARLDELSAWPSDDGRTVGRDELAVSVHRKPSVEEWLALDEREAAPLEATVALRRRLRKGALLLEVMLLPALHRESFARFGFDVRPCTADDLRAVIDAAAGATRAADAVLALWSPTGWTEQAGETAATGLGSGRRVVLVDQPAGRCAGADKYLGYVLGPTSDETALAECAEAVRNAIGGRSSLSLETLVEDSGFHSEIAQRCLRRLAATGDYVIDRFDDLGLVISRR